MNSIRSQSHHRLNGSRIARAAVLSLVFATGLGLWTAAQAGNTPAPATTQTRPIGTSPEPLLQPILVAPNGHPWFCPRLCTAALVAPRAPLSGAVSLRPPCYVGDSRCPARDSLTATEAGFPISASERALPAPILVAPGCPNCQRAGPQVPLDAVALGRTRRVVEPVLVAPAGNPWLCLQTCAA